MKYISLLLFLVLFSCGNKETILLPQSDVTLVKDVQNYSPIYFFFKTKGKDTLIEVNRKNSISSTNWIFHIDKRLPLRLVVPEIIKLQAKKEGSVHKSETSENYFSYSDSVHKNLAFVTFTKVKYQLAKSNDGVFYVPKNGFQLQNIKSSSGKIALGFDKNISFGKYLQYKIAILNLHLATVSQEEYVY
ncbi:MAG: hypothetical protein RLZZ323_592 [Bacteroidota bacterium]|jgi:hypothetical protein